MDEEESAGGIVFRVENGTIEYLILHYTAGHWDFPKGHVEEGETYFDTIHREVKEETNLDVEIIPGFSYSYDYVFKARYDNDRMKHKTVHFYVARAKDGEVKLSHEHNDYVWKNYEDAMGYLTYYNSKRMLKRAERFIRKVIKNDLNNFKNN